MAKRRKTDHSATQTSELQGVFPFFDLPAEIRNIIYSIVFVADTNIGHSCEMISQWIFVKFARQYRQIRQLEQSMINKQFFQESTSLFLSSNIFELHSFKALDNFLEHIGPVAAGTLTSLRVLPKIENPTAALCHLTVATSLKRLEIAIRASSPHDSERTISLNNAMDIVFNQYDKLDYTITLTDASTSTKEINHNVSLTEPHLVNFLMHSGYHTSNRSFCRLHNELMKFVKKKANGEYNTCRMKHTYHPRYMYKHVMDGTLKNYGWKRKGIKHYQDPVTRAPRRRSSNPKTCHCCACRRRIAGERTVVST